MPTNLFDVYMKSLKSFEQHVLNNRSISLYRISTDTQALVFQHICNARFFYLQISVIRSSSSGAGSSGNAGGSENAAGSSCAVGSSGAGNGRDSTPLSGGNSNRVTAPSVRAVNSTQIENSDK